jgi:hypothetical protein
MGMGTGRPGRKALNPAPSVSRLPRKMWEPRRLTTLWASMASYRDGFNFLASYHLCCIRIVVEPYKGRSLLPQSHGVSNSFTWLRTARTLRLAPTLQKNIARGNVRNFSNRTSCRPALCAKSEITASTT